MTRDEAIKIWEGPPNDFLDADDLIDKFINLGMLKVEDGELSEVGMVDKVRNLLVKLGAGHTTPGELYALLKQCGLKIVVASDG